MYVQNYTIYIYILRNKKKIKKRKVYIVKAFLNYHKSEKLLNNKTNNTEGTK